MVYRVGQRAGAADIQIEERARARCLDTRYRENSIVGVVSSELKIDVVSGDRRPRCGGTDITLLDVDRLLPPE